MGPHNGGYLIQLYAHRYRRDVAGLADIGSGIEVA
jgi:hypothetical protein